MKTAVSLIFEKFNLLSDSEFKSWMRNNYAMLFNLEENQMIESYRTGRTDQQNNSKSEFNRRAKDYFNQTFNQ